MEKDAVKQTGIKRARLLTAACLVLLSVGGLFAAPLDRTGGYEVQPQGNRFFVGQECGYELNLPGIVPSTVQMEIPDTPENVRFLTFKKEDYIDSEGYQGTRLQAWFMFSAPAEQVKLPPFQVRIRSRRYVIPVKAVTVYEDPARLFPEMFVVFDRAEKNSSIALEAGETVSFTLYVRYCTQILHYSWNLPKNSIFTETKRYEIAHGKSLGKEFSPDSFPVARFSWTPLVVGEYDLPPISVEAVAYNGARRQIAPVAKKLVVRAAAQKKEVAKDSRENMLFADAFAPPPEETALPAEKANAVVSDDEMLEFCQRLVDLRRAERNSLPFSRESAARKAFEKEKEIVAPAEPSKKLPVTLLAVAVAFALLAGALFLLRHPRRMIPPLIAALAFLGWSLWGYASLGAHYGIFTGGAVSSVPEESVSATVQVTGGIRVRIAEKAGDWVYITGDGCSGWVKTSAVLVIE